MSFLSRKFFSVRAKLLLGVFLFKQVYCSGKDNKLLQQYYTFGADRFACDGQCMYCRDSHAHARWGRVREILTTYKARHDRAVQEEDYSIARAWHGELQELLDWSWEQHKFECIPGIINLRLSSYCFTPLEQFSEKEDDRLDWLIQLNSHTGVLDLLQSAWPQLLQGGWPIFMLLDEVNRKMRAFIGDRERMQDYPKLGWDDRGALPPLLGGGPEVPMNESALTERQREEISLCDRLDAGTSFVEEYWLLLRPLLEKGHNLELGHHMGLVLKQPKCKLGVAVGLARWRRVYGAGRGEVL